MCGGSGVHVCLCGLMVKEWASTVLQVGGDGLNRQKVQVKVRCLDNKKLNEAVLLSRYLIF